MKRLGTEAGLWRRLESVAGAARHGRFTRIETKSALGVSDVEYVCTQGDNHGWIELKVVQSYADNRPLRFTEALKATQVQWLLQHHKPNIGLRSWLLVGLMGVRQWDGYLLMPPAVTVKLIERRLAPTLGELLALPGVGRLPHMQAVVDTVCWGRA